MEPTCPVTGIVVRGNLLGYSMLTNLHMNGQFASPVVENNILHSAQTGITIQNGTTNGVFQNNVIFNHSQQLIVMGCYWGNSTIFGHPQTGNRFLNNTMWQGSASYVNGSKLSGADAFRMYDSSTVAEGYACDMSGTVIENNIIETSDGPSLLFVNQHIPWLNAALIQHNLFYHPNTLGDRTMRWGAGPTYNELEVGNGSTYYTLPGSEGLYPSSFSANVLAEPLFTHAVVQDWGSVGSFDFSLQPGSPAIHTGSPAAAPAADIRGTPRGTSPSIGAYEPSNSGPSDNGVSCSFVLTPGEVSLSDTGGSAVVSVQTGSTCLWHFTSSASWVSAVGNGSGAGPVARQPGGWLEPDHRNSHGDGNHRGADPQGHPGGTFSDSITSHPRKNIRCRGYDGQWKHYRPRVTCPPWRHYGAVEVIVVGDWYSRHHHGPPGVFSGHIRINRPGDWRPGARFLQCSVARPQWLMHFTLWPIQSCRLELPHLRYQVGQV